METIRIYNVEIAESLMRTISVAACSEVEAVEKAAMKYRKAEVVLDSEDFVSVDFKVKSERKGKYGRHNI